MIYVNMKYLKCRYHPEIEETVKKYINVWLCIYIAH
jgi:hypothetical protein